MPETNALPAQDTGTAPLRDKLPALIGWLVLLGLVFRPLISSDFRNLGGETQHPAALSYLLTDLLVLVVIAVAIVLIVLGRIGSIAYNTFREAVRNKVLYFILFFALLLMGSSRVIKELAIGSHERIIANLGLGSISIFGTMVAVFVGISLVYNELEKKTIYTIVSKPVERYQFLLGKFFGLLLTIYVIVGIMTIFFFAVYNFEQMTTGDAITDVLYPIGEDGRRELVDNPLLAKTGFMLASAGKSIGMAVGNLFGFYAESGAPGVHPNLVIPVGMICIELLIVTAFAILFSSFTTPVLSAVFTVGVFLAGRLNEDIMRLGSRLVTKTMQDLGVSSIAELPATVWVKVRLIEAIAVLVPNLDSLNVLQEAIHNETFQVWRYSILYGLCYTGCVMGLAIVIFSRRNFK